MAWTGWKQQKGPRNINGKGIMIATLLYAYVKSTPVAESI